MNETQKQNRLARAIRHAEHDRLISGEYMSIDSEGIPNGCSVGCDAFDIQLANGVHVDDITSENCHAIVAEHDGTPEWLEWLRDDIFEEVPGDLRSWWHVELARALASVEKDITPEMWQAYFRQINIRILEGVLEMKNEWPESVRGEVAWAVELAIEYHRAPSEARREKANHTALNANSTACNAAIVRMESTQSARAAARTAVRSTDPANGKTCSVIPSAASCEWFFSCAASRAAYKRTAEAVIDVFRSEVIAK